ncbi:prolipoprotein diacylglyceryl transferase [Propioniciclava tarda]|uniref:Phosphatidylglycerol--prolipoprotein diacylglyceryl transferase n=1 Tax=Propioniciclava tarda TaxID=433330 RepID=A0A4Q9KNF7_PROTD|nr:prolipoprotein diacylglyceryl transferase [Propioniciclava tarda]TBT95825.1 prolipoprotein diacylglyceryl transferase [Propioniciclava tarda]SMO40163.1 Prolipoprotein diacylglyceryl transferase [Propioniciclava tarda]
MSLLFIPSPPINGVQLGPFFVHFYALTMLSGFAVAFLIGRRRWVTRGGDPVVFENIVMWAIPSGLVGARIYHVLTHWGDYFGPGHLNPFAIWEGGIAMFGSLMGGAIGALIAARLYKVRLWAFGDCIAPGIAVAQAVGRLGNWFNQELLGQPSTAPWALEIDLAHRPPGLEQFATFEPTFLYELLLNLLAAAIILKLDKMLRLGHGACFALYIALYGAIRFVIEGMRTDFSYYLGPLRTNQVTALAVCIGGAIGFVLLRRFLPGREAPHLEASEPVTSEAGTDASASE